MRTSKKKAQKKAQEDAEFEKLYRTIPASGMHAAFNADAGLFDEERIRRKVKRRRVVRRIIVILAVMVALTGLFLGWKFIGNIVKIFGWDGIKGIFHSQKLKGEDEGRVNILLAGNSSDAAGHGGAELTDSIMLISINTTGKKGYILSIPRDLYVDIPGQGYAKINEAYQDGKQDNFSEAGYATGGMGLLEKTVSERFGTKIHYYALVNYTALQQAVDAVGGIDITIESTDPRGLYDPSPDLRNNRKAIVNLPNGPVTLNGTAALGLSRARGNAYGSYGYGLGDFVRTENQRRILLGLKDKASSAGTLSNPAKLGQLFDSLGNNVTTDFQVSELRRLYTLTKEIPSASIVSASLNKANGKNLLESYRTRSGQSALVPAAGVDDYTEIQAYVNSL